MLENKRDSIETTKVSVMMLTLIVLCFAFAASVESTAIDAVRIQDSVNGKKSSLQFLSRFPMVKNVNYIFMTWSFATSTSISCEARKKN